MVKFDLERALSRVAETRKRPKLTKSQKLWYQLFDEKYGERIKTEPNAILNILLENKHLIK